MTNAQEQHLINACLEDCADDAPRLVYADWLVEAGRELEAELIRKQIQWRQAVLPSPYSDREENANDAATKTLAKEIANLEKKVKKLWGIGNVIDIVFRRGLPDTLLIGYGDRGLVIGYEDDSEFEARGPIINDAVARFKSVRAVDIDEGTFSGQERAFIDFLNQLKTLPILHSLSVDENNPTVGIEHLGQCAQLSHIAWTSCVELDAVQTLNAVRNGAAERFRALPPAERRIRQCLVIPTMTYMQVMETDDRFRSDLDVGQSFLTDADAVFFEGLPEVRSFTSSDCTFTSEALKSFATMPNLQSLELNRSSITDYSPLIEAPRLESVLVDDRHADPDVESLVALVQNNPSVRRLIVNPYDRTLYERLLEARPDLKLP